MLMTSELTRHIFACLACSELKAAVMRVNLSLNLGDLLASPEELRNMAEAEE